jgi:hypothetical protein
MQDATGLDSLPSPVPSMRDTTHSSMSPIGHWRPIDCSGRQWNLPAEDPTDRSGTDDGHQPRRYISSIFGVGRYALLMGDTKTRIMPLSNLIGYRLQRTLDDTHFWISRYTSANRLKLPSNLISFVAHPLELYDGVVVLAQFWLIVALTMPKRWETSIDLPAVHTLIGKTLAVDPAYTTRPSPWSPRMPMRRWSAMREQWKDLPVEPPQHPFR